MADAWLIAVVAGLGWCLARASLCAVAATQEVVSSGRLTGLRMQCVVAGSAGLVLLGLSLRQGQGVLLPGSDAALAQISVAAAVMAVGALLNGGCYLGSIMYLGRGKTNFLFTLLGIALAARIDLAAHIGVAAHARLVQAPTAGVLWLAMGVYLACVVATVRAARATSDPDSASRLAHTVIAGILAGVLMHQLPGWGYNAALASLGRGGVAPVDAFSVLLACVLFVAAVGSCLVAGQWKPEAPTLRGSLRCLAGGFVLETAAHAIPGGSDGLLLWAMPGLGVYGFLAYGVILVILFPAWMVAARGLRS